MPIVWRSPTELQLGGVTTRALVEAPSISAERFLESLRRAGTHEEFQERGARLGLADSEVEALLDLVGGLLEPAPVSPRRRSPKPTRSAVSKTPVVLVRGTVAGDDLAEHIAALACVVRRARADYLPQRTAEIGLVVDCADYVLTPRRYSPLMAEDIPHLAVIAEDQGATVGPLVQPGRTPCIRCDDLNRLDADRSWPAIATQLAVTSRVPLPRLTREIVRSLVVDAVSAWLTDGPRLDCPPSEVRTIDAVSGEVRRTRRSFHDECGCRVPPGSGTQDAPRHVAPRTARASDADASALG